MARLARVEEPSEPELNSIRNDAQRVATIRWRLSDISWWMRLLCQHVASRANRDDQETGKFRQSRYKAVRLLNETALLACAAYVDLNPIRAAMADTLEQSDFTSAQRRIQTLQAEAASLETSEPVPSAASETTAPPTPAPAGSACALAGADRFLAPVDLQERTTTPGPNPSLNGCRCSDKGFLPIYRTSPDASIEDMNTNPPDAIQFDRDIVANNAPRAGEIVICRFRPDVTILTNCRCLLFLANKVVPGDRDFHHGPLARTKHNSTLCTPCIQHRPMHHRYHTSS